jgi:cysteine synthase A
VRLYGRRIEIADDIAAEIGDTPLAWLDSFTDNLAGTVESFSPANSVKDRIGAAMLDCAERMCHLDDDPVVEATSGNTGIGLAMACVARGYDLVFTMPKSVSEERRALLTALGAEVVLTPGGGGTDRAIQAADAIAEERDGVVASQFENIANPEAHRSTTGQGIWDDTDREVDVFVAGVGTGVLSPVSQSTSKKNSALTSTPWPSNTGAPSGPLENSVEKRGP